MHKKTIRIFMPPGKATYPAVVKKKTAQRPKNVRLRASGLLGRAHQKVRKRPHKAAPVLHNRNQMHMDPDIRACDRARLARDPRFDGRFFTSVAFPFYGPRRAAHHGPVNTRTHGT